MAVLQPRILVVDDDPDILKLIEFALADEQVLLSFASDGEEALALAKEIKPDLVLLDIQLPRIDGLSVCRMLRNNESGTHPVIIMLSSLSVEHDLVEGFKGGADDYISKPFSVGNLRSRIKSWLLRRSVTAS
ncbi:MAG: response regulator transcription factor [Vulcanimicrobiota bacterium]